mmetsp:Transcript_44193/g.137628  ORF Transcript_44193/g.137628 Transcript_44193/m.137628 type:complete len:222 (+) Transcript_44193:235-900(+)
MHARRHVSRKSEVAADTHESHRFEDAMHAGKQSMHKHVPESLAGRAQLGQVLLQALQRQQGQRVPRLRRRGVDVHDLPHARVAPLHDVSVDLQQRELLSERRLGQEPCALGLGSRLQCDGLGLGRGPAHDRLCLDLDGVRLRLRLGPDGVGLGLRLRALRGGLHVAADLLGRGERLRLGLLGVGLSLQAAGVGLRHHLLHPDVALLLLRGNLRLARQVGQL